MTAVSMMDDEGGRTRQKQRTRSAIIAAARGLVAQGGAAPTVAEAAEAARSRGPRRTATSRARVAAGRRASRDRGDVPRARRRPTTPKRGSRRRSAGSWRWSGHRAAAAHDAPALAGTRPEARDAAAAPGPGDRLVHRGPRTARRRAGADGVRRLAVAVRAVAGIEALVWLTDVAGHERRRGDRADGLVGACRPASRDGGSSGWLRSCVRCGGFETVAAQPPQPACASDG